MQHQLKLGYMPTRRKFFSREDAIRYRKLILDKIRAVAPHIDIVDIDTLNEEGLIRDVAEGEAAARLFRAADVDALFVPRCNFGTEDAVTLAAARVGKPVLLWGPRDEKPGESGERLRDSQCGLFATSKVMQRFGVKFTYITNSRVDDPVFVNGFLNFLRAADAVRRFKNARIGQVATRPRGRRWGGIFTCSPAPELPNGTSRWGSISSMRPGLGEMFFRGVIFPSKWSIGSSGITRFTMSAFTPTRTIWCCARHSTPRGRRGRGSRSTA